MRLFTQDMAHGSTQNIIKNNGKTVLYQFNATTAM